MGLAMSAAAASAQSSRTVVSSSLALYRVSGDTMWYERDSTFRRRVYRGDTIETEQGMNGVVNFRQTVVVTGDSAEVISHFDALNPGAPRPQRVPAVYLTAEPTTVALMRRSEGLRAGLPSRFVLPTAPNGFPTEPITYCVDYTRDIVHHRDTVRYLRRTPGGRIDTTIYLFEGDTTVKRLSPSPRTFGHAMRVTLLGEMRMALIERESQARGSALPAQIPRAPLTGCARRK